MIVHFIASAARIDENIDSFRIVTKTIKEQGYSLTRDWIEGAYKNIQEGVEVGEKDWLSFVEEDFSAIAKADAVIADITFDSTAIGYQIATAVQQKKPTLLILREGRDIPAFTWNIPSEFLSKVNYSRDNIAERIMPFLKDNDIATKDMRFNFFIDRKIYNYLRWSSLKTGKTKAAILRELVEREINNKEY